MSALGVLICTCCISSDPQDMESPKQCVTTKLGSMYTVLDDQWAEGFVGASLAQHGVDV